MIGDPSDRNPHEHASSPQVPSGYRILTQAGRPNANKPATYILGRLPVVGGAGPDRAKQTLSGTAAVPAGVAADGGFPSTYATRCRPGHGQTPPTSAHSARVPALADSGEHGELWTTGPVVRGGEPARSAPGGGGLHHRRDARADGRRQRRPGRDEGGQVGRQRGVGGGRCCRRCWGGRHVAQVCDFPEVTRFARLTVDPVVAGSSPVRLASRAGFCRPFFFDGSQVGHKRGVRPVPLS